MTRRALFIALPLMPLLAQGKGKGKGQGKTSSTSVAIAFTNSDRSIITDWARRQSTANLPPGLTKRGGDLPPGLEKQLRRNGRLPPGWDKRSWSPFPPDLVRALPPLPADYDRGFIGGHAAIVLKGTQVVVEIFKPL